MSKENLIRMANDISAFFQAEPDRAQAVNGVLEHISKFWDPRMRSQIKSHYQSGGEGLSDLAKEAISRLV
jgi:formate dehydrogenase subunit delta